LVREAPPTAPTKDGVLVIDEHGDRKWGKHTAHVGRQWLANIGKTESGVVSVSSLWADEKIYWPVNFEPYTYTPAHHFEGGPQLENSLRSLLERAGGRTTTLGPGGVQQDRTPGSVLSAEEFEGILGPDVLFDLRCLLSESFGVNLRNLLSHGLVRYAGMYSAPVSYLCWLVLHLCAVPLLLRAREGEITEEEDT